MCQIKWYLATEYSYRTYRGSEIHNKRQKALFRASVWFGHFYYCKNMAVQHGRVHGREHAHYVDMKDLF